MISQSFRKSGWSQRGRSGFAEDQPGPQCHQRWVDMTAKVNVLHEMDSELLAQHSLQPMAAQLITGGADQIEQIAAKAQDVGRIKGGLQISRGGRLRVIFESLSSSRGLGA